MATKWTSPKWGKIFLAVGTAIFAISLTLLLIFPTLYKKILDTKIALTDGSLTTDIWRDIPLPIYERLYFFNITNGDAWLKGEEKLNVTEAGPYTYVGRWVKNKPQWNDNGTVSYRETRTYHFVPEMSVGSQDDEVHTLNGPMLIAADMVKNKFIAYRAALSLVFRLAGEKIVTKKKVRELAYEGYKDAIIDWAPVIHPNIPYKNGIFSWLYGKNDTDDGNFTVYTGEKDQSMTNFINNWNGEEKLSFWKGDTCNMLNGTSVEAGPPLVENQQTYTFFQSIFCRSLTFNYTGDSSILGVAAKRFEPTYMLFANGTENSDNECFDIDKGRPSGVLNLGPCQFDAPAYASFPHFHLADPSYLSHIEGLAPDAEGHGSFVDVEPKTGMSVNIRIRFQMNLQMSRVRGLLQFDDVPEGIFPVLWVDLSVAMDQHWADFLLGQLNNPKIIVYTLCGALLLVSLVMIIFGAVVLHRSKKDDDDDRLLDCEHTSAARRPGDCLDGPSIPNGGVANRVMGDSFEARSETAASAERNSLRGGQSLQGSVNS